MSDKHTPLPKLKVDDENHMFWFSHKNNVSENYHYITGDDENTFINIATTISKEHAEYIAKASNNHEVLVNRLRNLVNAESCRNCEDQGFYIIASNDGEPEQCQCKFCYTSPNSMFNRIAEAKQLLEQIGE